MTVWPTRQSNDQTWSNKTIAWQWSTHLHPLPNIYFSEGGQMINKWFNLIIFYSILSIIKINRLIDWLQSWLLSMCTFSASWILLVMGHPGTGHFGRWRDDLDGPGSFKSFSIEYSIEQIRSFEHFFKQGGAKGWSRNPEVLGNDWKPRQEPAYVRRLIAACRHPPQRPTFFRFESQLSVFFPFLYFRSVFTCVPQQFLKYWGFQNVLQQIWRWGLSGDWPWQPEKFEAWSEGRT